MERETEVLTHRHSSHSMKNSFPLMRRGSPQASALCMWTMLIRLY